MSLTGLLLLAFLLATCLMGATFALARRIDNYSVVDVAWAANFTPIVLVYAWLADGYLPRRALVATLVTLWSLRLALHLYVRVVRLHPAEDGRCRQLRKTWKDAVAARFFAFFQLQAALGALLSIPFLVACLDRRGPLDVVDAAAVLLFAVAFAGETIADRQLAMFKAANPGRVCDIGLWRYSRHPNYFFEWLVWVAYFLIAVRAPSGWGAAAAPLLMLFLLWRVTGIPASEAQALCSRGDAYRDYLRRTSAFFPWLSKRS